MLRSYRQRRRRPTVKVRLTDGAAKDLQKLAGQRELAPETLIAQLVAQELREAGSRAELRSLRASLDDLGAQTRHLTATLCVQRIPGLTAREIWGMLVKVKPYKIDFSNSPLDAYYEHTASETWVPTERGPLEDRIPEPWPTHFSNKPLIDPFNPWRFFDNALRIANHRPQDDREAAALERLAQDLVDRLLEYSELQGVARYVLYRFNREYKGHSVIAPDACIAGILEPVPMHRIVSFASTYDIGVFLLPPTNFNYRNALPNKLFEFIQARLAVAIGPSPQMAAVVREWNCGIVSDDFTPASLGENLQRLDDRGRDGPSP